MSVVLTEGLAQKAIPIVEVAYKAALEAELLKRADLHMVIMDPTQVYDGKPDSVIFRAAILLEHSFTEPIKWERRYDLIARQKAQATWRTGLPTRVIRECMPHLLEVGNTRYGGSVNVDGIIVACSGVQPWFDEMFAGIAAMILRGLANDHMQTVIIPGDEDFLVTAG